MGKQLPSSFKKLAVQLREMTDWYKANRPSVKTVHIPAGEFRRLAETDFGHGAMMGFGRDEQGVLWFDGFMLVPDRERE